MKPKISITGLLRVLQFAGAAVHVAALSTVCAGQPITTPPALLRIDEENLVVYVEDTSDASKFASVQRISPAVVAINFGRYLGIGDIVAVNGKPAKGTFIERGETINTSLSPTPGQAIADTTRLRIAYKTWEILQPDNTPVGTIVAAGLNGGIPAPGAPLDATRDSIAIIGGTGAFLGIRGQINRTAAPVPPFRAASNVEDPAQRRTLGGTPETSILQLIPMLRPEVVAVPSGPAVFHADFSPVTIPKPAKAGEVLIVMAIGLGPTRPSNELGQAFPSFPANPLAVVNSPVNVTINGRSADVINAVGWPGLVDTYRVDVRVPDGIATGTAGVQLTAAWIAGPIANIPVQ
jgi:uncharacterized protein (TIGR03437 family)